MHKVSFRKEINLFNQYYKLIDNVFEGKNNDLAIEAHKRLLTTDRYVKRIYKLNTKIRNFPMKPPSKRINKRISRKALQSQKRDIRNLEEFTEYFYYTSHRFIKIFRDLPQIGNIKKAGILRVRNNLLEHSDRKDSRILINSFSCGGMNGPVIKGPRYSHQINLHRDLGVYLNAVELKQILKTKLNYAITELKLKDEKKPKKIPRITTKRFTVVGKNRSS